MLLKRLGQLRGHTEKVIRWRLTLHMLALKLAVVALQPSKQLRSSRRPPSADSPKSPEASDR